MKLDERFNGAESRHAKLVEKAQKKKASKTKKAKRKYSWWRHISNHSTGLLINLCRYAKLDSEKNTINCETMEREMNDDLENDEEHPLDANIASPPQYVSEDTPEALDETDEAITGSEKSPEATSDCQRIGSINWAYSFVTICIFILAQWILSFQVTSKHSNQERRDVTIVAKTQA